MRTPLIVDAKGDVLVFDSVQKMLADLEAIDVKNKEYTAYDSDGRLLQLGTATTRVFFGLLEGPEVVTVEGEEPTATHAAQLRSCISDFMTRVGVDRRWVAGASHVELVQKVLNYRTR
jgi:hypothetical protein